MKAYSLDLRQKIADACDRKIGTQQQIADTFGVSLSFVEKLLRRKRTTGSIAPLPHRGGGKPSLDSEALLLLRRLVKENPDATLEELCEALGDRTGIKVSLTTMWTVLKRLRLPLKKSHSTPQNETAQELCRRGRITGTRSPDVILGD